MVEDDRLRLIAFLRGKKRVSALDARKPKAANTRFSWVNINDHALGENESFPGLLRVRATGLALTRWIVTSASHGVLVWCLASCLEPAPSGRRAHCRVVATKLIKVVADNVWVLLLKAHDKGTHPSKKPWRPVQ
jgi:hypothetical protein